MLTNKTLQGYGFDSNEGIFNNLKELPALLVDK